MKLQKYTSKHLESVPPEYIAALEYFLNRNDISHCYFCCVGFKMPSHFSAIDCFTGDLCAKYIKYKSFIKCPCNYFGSFEEASKHAWNLINQWKKWAQVEDE